MATATKKLKDHHHYFRFIPSFHKIFPKNETNICYRYYKYDIYLLQVRFQIVKKPL